MAVPRVALVTGGGTGIGRSAALALQGAGFSVVVAGRRRDRLERTVAAGGGGPAMLAVPADVTDPDQVRALFEAVRGEHGRLDVLFNNAGVAVSGTAVEDLDVAEWRRSVDVNLTGSFLCAQEAIRLMKAQDPRGGRIINNGSVSAHSPRPGMIAYTATKHAVSGLTKGIALEGRRHGIACSQIDIGNADTEIAERLKAGALQPDGRTLAEPVMDVGHCGEAVAYIAGLPLDVNVLFMTIMATKMPFVGRG